MYLSKINNVVEWPIVIIVKAIAYTRSCKDVESLVWDCKSHTSNIEKDIKVYERL